MTGNKEKDDITETSPHILIVEARYYEEIGEMLLAGAEQVLNDADVTFERVNVPGALEIPAAIRIAIEAGQHDAYVALGCVIEGETWKKRADPKGKCKGGDAARAILALLDIKARFKE